MGNITNPNSVPSCHPLAMFQRNFSILKPCLNYFLNNELII